MSFTISFKGRDCYCSSFTLNNYQTYFTICSRAKRRMKKQAHLNHGTSRSCDETVVWQNLKNYSTNPVKKQTRQPHHYAPMPSSNLKDAKLPLHEMQGKRPWAALPRLRSCHHRRTSPFPGSHLEESIRRSNRVSLAD